MKRWRTKKDLPGIKAGTVADAKQWTAHSINWGEASYGIIFIKQHPDFFEEFEEREWWVPEFGDRYFIFSDDCTIQECESCQDSWDKNHSIYGNVFKTREEAELAAAHLKKSLREFHSMRKAVLSPEMFVCGKCNEPPSSCQCRYKEQPRD